MIKELKTKFPIKKKRYWVEDTGKVYWKDKTGELRLMKPFTTRDGYLEYVLTRVDGSKQHIQGQLIVLSTFKGYPSNIKSPQGNHKNGKRKDNRLSNLEWVTPKQNIRHSFDILGKKVKKGPRS